MECIAYNRQPKYDFNPANDSTKAIFAAYWSVSEGKRVYLYRTRYDVGLCIKAIVT